MKTGREASDHRSLITNLTLVPPFSYMSPVHSNSYVHYLNSTIPQFLSQFPPLHFEPQSLPQSLHFFHESYQSLPMSYKSYLYPHSVSPEILSQSQPFFLPSQMSQTKLSPSLENNSQLEKNSSSFLVSEEEINIKKESFNIKFEHSDVKVEDDSEMTLESQEKDEKGRSDLQAHPNKKYGTFSKEEKQVILDFLRLNGVSASLEKFGPGDPRVTRRKLRNWLLNIGKPKNVKGKKTNDPDRNEALFEWMKEFKEKYARPPTRRELRQKALEVSNDQFFIASKGWLDKFTKKFKVDLTPIKNISMK